MFSRPSTKRLSPLFAAAFPLLLAAASCLGDPHRPDAAFVASCSTEGADALTRGVVSVEPHYELSSDHVEHHTRGAKIQLSAQVDAKRLETALRCQAARVDRKARGRTGVLEVSPTMPEIVVTSQASGTLVLIAASNDKDGEAILASAKALAPR
ncbi:MAG: hypothetical protein U0183_12000 [Polyangiaceae bacterium]